MSFQCSTHTSYMCVCCLNLNELKLLFTLAGLNEMIYIENENNKKFYLWIFQYFFTSSQFIFYKAYSRANARYERNY